MFNSAVHKSYLSALIEDHQEEDNISMISLAVSAIFDLSVWHSTTAGLYFLVSLLLAATDTILSISCNG